MNESSFIIICHPIFAWYLITITIHNNPWRSRSIRHNHNHIQHKPSHIIPITIRHHPHFATYVGMCTKLFFVASPGLLQFPFWMSHLGKLPWEPWQKGAHGKKVPWNNVMASMAKRAMTTPKGILSELRCFIIMIHHDESSWFIMMLHHDESSGCIMTIHHDDTWPRLMMMNHDDPSWWFIVMHHHDAFWRFMMMN